MECENNNCTRTATIKNQEYHPDKWLCTYHANKEKVKGRLKKKLTKLNELKSKQDGLTSTTNK